MASNPFDSDKNDDDFNPFAAVNVYNPFPTSSSSSAPRIVVNTSSSPPPDTSSRRNDEDQPFGKIDSDFYNDNAPTKASSSSSSSSDDVHFKEPPRSSSSLHSLKTSSGSSSQTASGNRVNVTTSEEKANDDEPSMWSIEFYKKYFNIDSTEVGWRCLRSLWPFKLNFIQFVHTNPDFYGPFWITTTLIFMLAAASNFSSFIRSTTTWQFDFFKLTTGAGIVWGYTFISPVLFWLYFNWVDLNVSLIEMCCIYGYSLFAYFFVAVLCTWPLPVLQWTVVTIACLLSTSFLVMNMWLPLRSKVGHAILICVVMAVLHAGFGLAVQLFYFQEYATPPSTPTPTPTPTPQPQPQPLPLPPKSF